MTSMFKSPKKDKSKDSDPNAKELQQLVRSLKKTFPPPETIDLCDRNMKSTSILTLLEAIKNMPTKSLLLSANCIDDDGGVAIARFLETNRKLTELDVSFNRLTDKSILKLIQAVRITPSIVSCSVMGNDCSAYLEHDLQQILSHRRSEAANNPVPQLSYSADKLNVKSETKKKTFRPFGLGTKALTVSFPTGQAEEIAPEIERDHTPPDESYISKRSPYSLKIPRFAGKGPHSHSPRERKPSTPSSTEKIFAAVVDNDPKILADMIKKRVNIHCTDRNGRRPIHRAVMQQMTERVQLLVDAGADVDSRDRWGDTPLHWAALKGDYQILSILLDNGANFSLFTRNGLYPLHAAVRGGSLKCVAKLLEMGAEVDVKTRKGLSPLHIAVFQNRNDIAQLLIKSGANINGTDTSGRTPLHWACLQDNHTLCKTLIESGASANAKSHQGEAPLHCAVMGSSPACALLLLDANADPFIKDNEGKNPLHYVAFYGNTAILEVFLGLPSIKGLSILVDTNDNYEETPLHWAIIRGHLKIATILQKMGANLKAKNKNGDTILHMLARCPAEYSDTAATQQLSDSIKYVVSTLQVDINASNQLGQSPLHIAIQERNEVATALYLEANANPNYTDINGKAALHCAAIHGAYASMRILLKSKQTYRIHTDLPDRTGATAFHLACMHGHLEIVRLLLSCGANVHALDVEGCNALHRTTNPEILAILLSHHCAHIEDLSGKTPLDYAAEAGNIAKAIWLLENKVAPIPDSAKQESPSNPCTKPASLLLHLASGQGDIELAEQLLSLGFCVNCVTKKGHTPIEVAAMKRQTEMVKFLHDKGAKITSLLLKLVAGNTYLFDYLNGKK